MKVQNVHKRLLPHPADTLAAVLNTLGSDKDKIWPKEKWPPMRLKRGLEIGSEGGHGPIRYRVEKFDQGKLVVFRFLKPAGFSGTHSFEISEYNSGSCEIKHTIKMNVHGLALLQWVFAIRWLHDALIEDTFDKVERNFNAQIEPSRYSIAVKLMRMAYRLKTGFK